MKITRHEVVLPYTGHVCYWKEDYADHLGGSRHTTSPAYMTNVHDSIANDLQWSTPKPGEKCRYCRTPLDFFNVFDRSTGTPTGHNWKYNYNTEDYSGDALECPYCGWWTFHVQKGWSFGDECMQGEYQVKDTFFEGVVYRFDMRQLNRPVMALRREIAEDKVDLCSISPRSLEIVVASVFRDFFRCRATHVGGPNDDGIDVILIDGDVRILVQVKRHRSPVPRESVRVVRELVGTLVLNRANRGVIVTSACDLSPAGKEAIDRASATGGLSIDVYNQERLRDILELTQPPEQPWLALVPEDVGLSKAIGNESCDSNTRGRTSDHVDTGTG